jgi:metallophosphoesterase (TIGR00282 family)
MRILMIGDVFGTLGQKALNKYIGKIKQDYKPQFIILNGENINKGFGITLDQYKMLMEMNVNVVTMGNHTFSNRKIIPLMDELNIIRPVNYDDQVPGRGYLTFNFNNEKITVINMMGRIFMGDPLDNPFKVIDDVLKKIDSDTIIVDFHGEATSEKLAFGHHVDGRVTAVFGTHTHVPTNDAMRLPNGTFYITDVGMTGAKYGILGAKKEKQVEKFITNMPTRIEEETDGLMQLNAVFIDTDFGTIKTINIHEN